MSRDPSSRLMRRTLRLAARGAATTAPNPRVGALLVRDGSIVGEGWHRRAGGAHAEVEAIRAAGDRARGATLYVNLEPCAHHGRTPPCADAVAAAGVSRVVVAHLDPNPQVAGRGLERLRAAGLSVEVGLLAAEAVRLNLPFLVPHLLARPTVTLKWAMSLDGKIATAAGDSRWISGPRGRRWGLGLREEHDAILVGVGTVLADDPLLTRRLGRAEGPILRVVLDRRLRTPPTSRLFTDPGLLRIYTEADPAAAPALAAIGAAVVRLAAVTPGAVLADLRQAGVASVMVEGGAGVHASFVADGAYDRVAVDLAPRLVGGAAAPGPLAGEGVQRLVDAPVLEGLVTRRAGTDLLLDGLRGGLSADLLRRLLPTAGQPAPSPSLR